MFRPETILQRLREKPFRPLRFIVSEGLRYSVLHPDLVLVGERDVMIGYPSAANPVLYDQVARVAIAHLVAIEDLPSTAETPENGELGQ